MLCGGRAKIDKLLSLLRKKYGKQGLLGTFKSLSPLLLHTDFVRQLFLFESVEAFVVLSLLPA